MLSKFIVLCEGRHISSQTERVFKARFLSLQSTSIRQCPHTQTDGLQNINIGTSLKVLHVLLPYTVRKKISWNFAELLKPDFKTHFQYWKKINSITFQSCSILINRLSNWLFLFTIFILQL